MKSLTILLALVVGQATCSGFFEGQSTSFTVASSDLPPPPPPPTLNIVDAQITTVGVPGSGTNQEIHARNTFAVEGTFRVQGGSKSGPPPVAIIVRNRRKVIADSTAVKSEQLKNDEYIFSGDIRKISKPGEYTIEVRVQKDIILKRDLKVLP